MHKLPGLLDQRLGDGRMRVAQRAHRDASSKVEIPFPLRVPHMRTRPAREHEIKPSVGGIPYLRNNSWMRTDSLRMMAGGSGTISFIKLMLLSGNHFSANPRVGEGFKNHRMRHPSYRETLSTPESRAVTALSICGIMPLSTTPVRFAPSPRPRSDE